MKFCALLTRRQRRLGSLPRGYVFRLPTEAEWEYCCRAGSPSQFSFGDDPEALGNYANWSGTRKGRPTVVGSYKPNAWGLYDMHGNVWEWCYDHYGLYDRLPAADPVAATLRHRRHGVIRGGSYRVSWPRCRAAWRYPYSPQGRSPSLGFRVVLAPPVNDGRARR